MSDTARHDDLPATAADGDASLPLTDALMAPMPMPRRAARPATDKAPSKPAGKSDGAFERALEALEGALEAAISDPSAFIPAYTAPVTKLTPPTSTPTPVARLTPQAKPMPTVTVAFADIAVPVSMPATVQIAAPVTTPTVSPEPAVRTIEPKFLPQEDVGDGDPIFVTPEFERTPAPSTTSAAAQEVVARSMVSRSALRAATYGYGIPPLLLAAESTLRVRAAAKAVIDALPKIDLSPVSAPAQTVDAVVTPVVETVAPTPQPETTVAAAEAIDPYVLYPFGKTTLRLMVM